MERNRKANSPQNNFWPGFSFGMIFGVGGLYLLGTSQGRRTLRKLIDTVENLDLSLGEVLEELEGDIVDNIPPVIESANETGSQSHIHDVLEKIRSVLPTKKEVKKYFVKDGKIIK